MKSGKIDLLNPAALLMLVGNYFVPSGMPKLFVVLCFGFDASLPSAVVRWRNPAFKAAPLFAVISIVVTFSPSRTRTPECSLFGASNFEASDVLIPAGVVGHVLVVSICSE
jgi:hypothetical protein